MKRWQALAGGLVVVGAWAASCSPHSFQSATVVDTVRILASRATEPRAKPGDAVKLDVLAYDGRTDPAEKMILSWLPIPCVNPAGDAYYACFSQFRASVNAGGESDAGAVLDAGVEGGRGLGLRPGVDLTPVLASGSTFSYTVPTQIIVPRVGVSPSYGLVILFNFACGGHLELLPVDPGSANPQQIPIGCFDSHHNQLGPDDFVFGFTRIYVYDQPNEVNPTITAVDVPGASLGIDGGMATAPFAIPLCTDNNADTCPHRAIGPIVPPSEPGGKQVWADFFSTVGTFTSDARLLYGPMVNLKIPSETDDGFMAPIERPDASTKNFIWVVVHDDQGGADWVTIPLQIQ
jgi:hypothetical protein